MNRNQYMEVLERELRGFSELDRREILKDYNNFFEEGMSDGRTEEEVSKDLGDPRELARNLREERRAYISQEQEISPREPEARDNLKTLVIVGLVLFFGFPVIMAIGGTIIGLFAGAISLIVTGSVLIFSNATNISFMTTFFAGLSLICLGSLGVMGLVKIIQLIVTGLRALVKRI